MKESSGCEIMKKGKETSASFAVIPHTVKIIAMVHGKCLVTMEKALNCGV